MKLVFLADPNDGLGREREAPQLRALGRSFTEPAVQAVYRAWTLAFIARFRPEYVGLVAETNLIRFAAPPALYAAIVAAAARTAAEIKALADPPRLFVSVQVETAWGKLVGQPYLGIERAIGWLQLTPTDSISRRFPLKSGSRSGPLRPWVCSTPAWPRNRRWRCGTAYSGWPGDEQHLAGAGGGVPKGPGRRSILGFVSD